MTGEVETENYILAQANLRLAQHSAPHRENNSGKLVIRRKVASSTQSQALNAVILIYRQVLQHEQSQRIEFVHAKKIATYRLY